jgi:hypothetical protein
MTGSTRPVVLVDRPAPRAAHSVQAADITSDATARSAGRRAGRQFGEQTFANAVHRRGSAGLRSISVGKLEGTSATPHCANARTANIARMRGPPTLRECADPGACNKSCACYHPCPMPHYQLNSLCRSNVSNKSRRDLNDTPAGSLFPCQADPLRRAQRPIKHWQNKSPSADDRHDKAPPDHGRPR